MSFPGGVAGVQLVLTWREPRCPRSGAGGRAGAGAEVVDEEVVMLTTGAREGRRIAHGCLLLEVLFLHTACPHAE